MKSFSDDLPNVTRDEVHRATVTAQEAVDVSKATLAAVGDEATNMRKLMAYVMAAIIINVVIAGVSLGIVAHHILG